MRTETGRRAVVLAIGGLAVIAAAGLVSVAGAADEAAFCRASLVRVTLPGGAPPIEPVVAEGTATDECIEDNAGVGLVSAGPVALRVLYASTDTSAPNAEAGVANVVVSVPGAPVVAAEVLTSEASVTCNGSTPVLSGRSRVVGLTVAGTSVVIPPTGTPSIPPNPLVLVVPNEQTTSGTTLTQRALHVTLLPGTPGEVDVVIAESQAGYVGNPCEPTTPEEPRGKRMTGGGKIAYTGGEAAHGFVLPCDKTASGGRNLNVNGDFGHFKLGTLSSVKCTYDTNAGPPQHAKATFNTLEATGTGTCNGAGSVPISLKFTDEGEPNAGQDEVTMTISSPGQPCYLALSKRSFNGNHQAHG